MSLPEHLISVVVAQQTSTEDISSNENQILKLLNSIKNPSEVDLVVFPENSLFLMVSLEGKTKEDRIKNSFKLDEPIFEKLKDFCQANDLSIILGSLPYFDGEHVYNATVLIELSGAPMVIYKKIHLFDVDVEGEKSLRESDQYDRGSDPATIQIKDWKLGLSICYDLRFPELYLEYSRQKVDALLVPAAFLVPTGKAHWHILNRARAIENQCFVLAPAQGGEHKGPKGKSRKTFGHSLIIDPWGKVLAEKETDGPGVIEAILDPSVIGKTRKQIPMDQHRTQRLWSP